MLKRARNGGTMTKRARASARQQHFDNDLAVVLISLARVLIESDYGVAALRSATRRAFFEAAKQLGDNQGKRLSGARIAAITGLTRVEVSKLSRAEPSHGRIPDTPTSRSHQVAKGWSEDDEFINDSGQPLTLPFAGKRASFSRLVKKYSGDIPARAMLLEMKRFGMIRSESDGAVRLVRSQAAVARRTLAALNAAASWLKVLGTSVGEGGTELLSTTDQVKLTFASLPQAIAAAREVDSRRRAFIKALETMSVPERGANCFVMEVGVATASVVHTKKPQKTLS